MPTITALDAPSLEVPTRSGRRSALRSFLPHLLSLVLPLCTLAFLLTGPHPWHLALPWLLAVVVLVGLDLHARPDRRQPEVALPALPFDLLVVGLAGLQLAAVALMVRMVSGGVGVVDGVVTVVMVGLTSGYTGIVVAHELIHRPTPELRLLGRGLLVSVMYEHFYTEHLRGHHARVGTAEDPATARYGETFFRFLRRTVPAQFRSAWQLESSRVARSRPPLRLLPRILRSRVLHGLLVEWSVALSVLVLVGPIAFFFFLMQAALAVLLLEAVNYFEHWGLVRSGKRVAPVDSWDTESWFTLHTLVGLSRHADHHAYASRPYQSLRVWPESPKLPTGYYGMVLMSIFSNRRVRTLLSRELERVRLGPFVPSA